MSKLFLLNIGYSQKSTSLTNDTLHYSILYSIVNIHELILRQLENKECKFDKDSGFFFSFYPVYLGDKSYSINRDFYFDHFKRILDVQEKNDEDLCIISISAHGGINKKGEYQFQINDTGSLGNDFISGSDIMKKILQIAKTTTCFIIGNTCSFDSKNFLLPPLEINNISQNINLSEPNHIEKEIPPNYITRIWEAISYIPSFFSRKTVLRKRLSYYFLKSNEIEKPIIILGGILEVHPPHDYIDAIMSAFRNDYKISYEKLHQKIYNRLVKSNSKTINSLSALIPAKNSSKWENIFKTSIFFIKK